MSREMYLMDGLFAAALLAGGLVERQDDVIVFDGRSYRERESGPTEPPIVLAPPEPTGPTESDLERLRQASLRRARKTARQARGFSPPQVKEGGN